MFDFTNREFVVIKKIIEGKTKKQIASELFISYHTVKAIVEHIYEKANVHSKIELVVFLLKNGFDLDCVISD